MDAHGGYLCRIEGFGELDLAAAARDALAADGADVSRCQLQLSTLPRRKIVRLAFQAPFADAAWYVHHHALARTLSVRLNTAVHAYAYQAGLYEQVVTYGNGRKVGGESLDFADVELDDDLDEEGFAQLASRWPLGHLAYVYGVPRDLLLGLPRAKSLWIPLEGEAQQVSDLWGKTG